MHFCMVALGLLTLITPLLALPHSEAEVLEQLRGIPNGWVQVGFCLRSPVQVLMHAKSRVLPLQLLHYSNFGLLSISRDRPNLSKWSLTCQLPITHLMVST